MGREEVFPHQGGSVSFGRLGECGVWTIIEPESGRELAKIACNLFNSTESNLHSSNEAPKDTESDKSNESEQGAFHGPLWYYLALFALFLTAAEWFLYQRRWIE
jgi:hypothetical protein